MVPTRVAKEVARPTKTGREMARKEPGGENLDRHGAIHWLENQIEKESPYSAKKQDRVRCNGIYAISLSMGQEAGKIFVSTWRGVTGHIGQPKLLRPKKYGIFKAKPQILFAGV